MPRMKNAAPEEDVEFKTKVENPEKKEGNGHGEISICLSISPVLSHWKFLPKPNYRLSGLKSHLGKQKVFFSFHGNMKGIEMLIASE